MTIRATALLLALTTLAACAYAPPLQTNRLDIRQVPYTPDSGTIALRCGLGHELQYATQRVMRRNDGTGWA